MGRRAILVILYLINRADDNMTCFPSVKRIAGDCSMSTRTVQRAINDLIHAGFLIRESRFHEKGGQRSNYYTILAGNVDIKEVNLFVNEKSVNESSSIANEEESSANNSIIKSVLEWLKQSFSAIFS